ncbi:hypothetical protein HJFPF1_13601 [Paramyrothecium foliicola]|nr:hypothetical protein HJFPF1_13601 [Paramyrothecium foliicola]
MAHTRNQSRNQTEETTHQNSKSSIEKASEKKNAKSKQAKNLEKIKDVLTDFGEATTSKVLDQVNPTVPAKPDLMEVENSATEESHGIKREGSIFVPDNEADSSSKSSGVNQKPGSTSEEDSATEPNATDDSPTQGSEAPNEDENNKADSSSSNSKVNQKPGSTSEEDSATEPNATDDSPTQGSEAPNEDENNDLEAAFQVPQSQNHQQSSGHNDENGQFEGYISHLFGRIYAIDRHGPLNAPCYTIRTTGLRKKDLMGSAQMLDDNAHGQKKENGQFIAGVGDLDLIKGVAWAPLKTSDGYLHHNTSLAPENWTMTNNKTNRLHTKRPLMRILVQWRLKDGSKLKSWEKWDAVERCWPKAASLQGVVNLGNKCYVETDLQLGDTIVLPKTQQVSKVTYAIVVTACRYAKRHGEWKDGNRESKDRSPTPMRLLSAQSPDAAKEAARPEEGQ